MLVKEKGALAIIRDIAGKLKAVVSKDTIVKANFEETVARTTRSLMTVSRELNDKGMDAITPKALIFITRIEKGQYANAETKRRYEEIKEEVKEYLVSKAGETKGLKMLKDIEDSWTKILSKKDRFLYMSQLYETVFLPSFKTKNEVIPIPMFDSYIIGNCVDYMSLYMKAIQSKEDKVEIDKCVDLAEKELKKMQSTAKQFFSGNKLFSFIKGFYKTTFNVLSVFTHGAYDINDILVPEGLFPIGAKVAGMRHPVMSGVVLFRVVGYTQDNTIKIDEIHFKRFQADCDGDFFLVSELMAHLITGN